MIQGLFFNQNSLVEINNKSTDKQNPLTIIKTIYLEVLKQSFKNISWIKGEFIIENENTLK